MGRVQYQLQLWLAAWGTQKESSCPRWGTAVLGGALQGPYPGCSLEDRATSERLQDTSYERPQETSHGLGVVRVVLSRLSGGWQRSQRDHEASVCSVCICFCAVWVCFYASVRAVTVSVSLGAYLPFSYSLCVLASVRKDWRACIRLDSAYFWLVGSRPVVPSMWVETPPHTHRGPLLDILTIRYLHYN